MDSLLFQKINSLTGQWALLDAAGVFFAEYLPYILTGLIFLVFYKKWDSFFQAVLAAVLARFIVVELIRQFWDRPRPFIENNVNLLLEHSNSPSFPSGHAAFFFALATVVYFYNKKIGIGFFAASFLVSASRVLVGVHWPSDVLAGAIVGILSAWLVMKLFKK